MRHFAIRAGFNEVPVGREHFQQFIARILIPTPGRKPECFPGSAIDRRLSGSRRSEAHQSFRPRQLT